MPPERTAQTYGPGITAASKAVLLELMTVLRAYREALVLVGGWAPYVLLERHRRPGDSFAHVGSIDIDLAVDPSRVEEPEYATIVELLRERGYRPATTGRGGVIPHSMERAVQSPATQKPYAIRVDFLTPPAPPPTTLVGGPAGRAPGRSHPPTTPFGGGTHAVPVQDELLARKVKGCEAAFAHHVTIEMRGTLPDGGELTVPVRVADLVAMLTMKGIVLGERYREKDAYDLYALVGHCGAGPRAVADAVRPHLADPLVREAMTLIRSAFGRREANGPAWVASFLVSPVFTAERERLMTDAFMVVREFLAHLGEA